MRTGNLRHIVTVQQQDSTQDAVGQQVNTWADIARRRCSIEPLNGREFLSSFGETAQVSTRIRMRYDTSLRYVKAHDRIVDYAYSPAVVYDILSVINPKERNHEVIFMCERHG